VFSYFGRTIKRWHRWVLLGIKPVRVEHHISLKERVLPSHLQFVGQLVASGTATTLAEHLRKQRLNRGLTQKQAAAQIGTTHYTLSEWELGKATPRRSCRRKLVAWLGFDPEVERNPAK
jgi:ribosome-binding protein aMBF1 (putative translation factor)